MPEHQVRVRLFCMASARSPRCAVRDGACEDAAVVAARLVRVMPAISMPSTVCVGECAHAMPRRRFLDVRTSPRVRAIAAVTQLR